MCAPSVTMRRSLTPGGHGVYICVTALTSLASPLLMVILSVLAPQPAAARPPPAAAEHDDAEDCGNRVMFCVHVFSVLCLYNDAGFDRGDVRRGADDPNRLPVAEVRFYMCNFVKNSD